MKSYTAIEIAGMVGVSSEAIKYWEAARVIPLARREGGKHRRLWSEHQTYLILQYAEGLGYRPQYQMLINYAGGSSETKTKESGQ